MAKKDKSKAGNTAHAIAARRFKVSRLLASGYSQAEVARRLKVHHATIQRDAQELDEQWYWRARLDTDKRKRDEIRHLEEARREAWRAFYECANRHGEIRQAGYLGLVLKATQALHELLRLNDPAVDQGAINPEHRPKVIEVTVRTREQVELLNRGSLEFSELVSLGPRDG